MDVKPSQFDVLARLLDVTATRHQVLANNIANVNTPGYKRLEVSFEEQLASAIQGSGGYDLQQIQPRIEPTRDAEARPDGNTVDINTELGALTKNTLLHQAYTRILATQISQMRTAINGRT
jgi:flagellar basal-body rod protein FlgB